MTTQYYRTGVSIEELKLLLAERLPTDARALYFLGFRQFYKGPKSPVCITYRQIQEIMTKAQDSRPSKRRIATMLEHLQRTGLVDKYRNSYSDSNTYVTPLALPWGGLYEVEYKALSSPNLGYAACCIYTMTLRPLISNWRYGMVSLRREPFTLFASAISPYSNTRRHLTRSDINSMLVDALQELITEGLIARNDATVSQDIEPLSCHHWILPLVASESQQIGLRGQEHYAEWLAALQ
jgi:hypothetical protein